MNTQLLLPLSASIVGCLSVLMLVLAVGRIITARHKFMSLEKRLHTQSGRKHYQKPQSLGRRLSDAAGKSAKRIGERMQPGNAEELSALALKLVRGGITVNGAPAMFWGAKLLLTLSGGLLGLGIKIFADDVPMRFALILITVPAAFGLYLPDIWLNMRVAARRRDILCALPDALDLLVVCVESGMGLDQALNRVGREIALTSPTLSNEFKTLILELRAGMKRSDALKNLALRVDLEDMSSLVTLINQADAFGTSIAGTLRVYSDALRTTRKHRAEERAAKMPVKLLFPLVFFIMPALFVAIMGPAAIQLMKIFSRF